MKKNIKRRDFLKKAAVGGAAVAASTTLAAPAIAASKVDIAIVTTWPRDFPGLGTGAQRFGQRLIDMSDGRFNVEYFAAGERVGAFDSFDEVASGNAQIYHAADYYWKGKHPGWAYFTSVPFGLTYVQSLMPGYGLVEAKHYGMNWLESTAFKTLYVVTPEFKWVVGLIKKSIQLMILRV